MHTITSMRLYLIVFTIVLFFPSLLESAAYTVRNTGDWSGTTTWQRNGSNTTIPPTITDNVTIGGNHTVTITAAAVCLTLTFANDANNSILTMNDGTTLTVNGNVIFNSPTGNNHNKTWNINAATATVNGNITLNEGTDDTRITRINITSGTLDVNGSISFANITSDTRTAINISGAGNIYIAGDLTSTGSYGTLAPGTSGTVTFDSTNAQTISLVGGMLFNNVVVNKPSGTATFSILSGPYFEAENATMSGAVFANDHPGYSGTGFADYLNLTGDYVEWTINTGNVVTTELIFRYALDTTNRTLELRVNGVVADDSLTFTRVGPEWTNYSVLHSNPVNLIAGANTIRLTAIGESGPNLDYLAVIPLNSAVIGNFSVLSGTAVIANSFMVYGNLTVNGTLDLSTFTMNGNSSGKILAIGATGTLLVGGTAGGVTGSNFPMGYNGTPNINTTSRVSYNGTASQTIANSITYGTLEMNNTAGVNLSNGNITASTLSVITGTMTTGANVMRVLSARTGNGLINGALRHVHAFITGTYYYFEGPNTYVRPTAMTTTPDSITITSYPNTNIPVGNPAYAIKRYYDIIQHGGSGLTSTLRLHYDTAERNGLTESLFTLWRYNGTAWEDKLFSSRVTGSANSYVEQTGITQFSDWTIAEGAGPLPVQLTSFTASAKKFDVTLEWKTASEKNNYGFDIERQSTDGVWTKIGFVGGHGTTTVPQEYSYTDRNAPSGRLSYRLKQTDFDGAFEYSNVVEVISGATDKSFMLGQNYPSPFNPVTTIEFSIPDDSPTSLKVYNTLGQEVASLVDGEILPAGLIHKVTFNGTNLSSGTYYYILKSGKFSAVRKMILLK